jgi:hypothetical protein
LENFWCKKLYNCKWSHEIRYNPLSDVEFTVVNHGADNMRMWTLRAMLKKAWITEEDFLENR